MLDQGTVAEFDSPHHLLQSPTSIFAKLVHETGEGSARSLRAAAANTSSRH